jgi:hypothetical protein
LNFYNKTISLLEKNKNLKLLKSQLNPDQYIKNLLESDIIFLPYQSEFYRYRTSSIFYEGIYAEKIVIVTPDTWMSSFYNDNLILKKLILSNENNLQKILNYINKNYYLLIKNIILLKKSIIKKNNISSLKLLFNNSSNSKVLFKNNTKCISFLVDENTINRRVNGNQFGTINIIRNIFNDQILFNKKLYFNIIVNRNFDSNYALFTMNNELRIFSFKNIYFNLVPCISKFLLKNNQLNFDLKLKDNILIFKDLILINYHFYKKYIKKINHLKKIILVHDVYSKLNNESQFLDHKNNHYVFVSYFEFLRNNFLNAKKYLIFPIYIDDFVKNNNLSKNFSKYNYSFVSSGSDVDILNLKKILQKLNRPIHLFGEICYKLDNNFVNSNSSKLILKGFVNNLEDHYSNAENVFLVPRYSGIGIPIKFLQLIKFRSKVILFGDIDSFGMPTHLVEDFLYKENQNLSVEEFIYGDDYCRGIANGKQLKACVPGGSSVPILPHFLVTKTAAGEDRLMTYESLAEGGFASGSMLGSGGFIVFDEDQCIVRNTWNFARFYAHESCGQCSPCREGTGWMEKVLSRIEHGQGHMHDIDLLADINKKIEGNTICPLGDAAAWPVAAAIHHFREEFEWHIKHPSEAQTRNYGLIQQPVVA